MESIIKHLILPLSVILPIYHSVLADDADTNKPVRVYEPAMLEISLEKLPNVGDTLQGTKFDEIDKSDLYLMTGPAQFDLSFAAEVDGILYSVAFDKKHIVTFVATTDSAFASPEGIKVGTPMTETFKISGIDSIDKLAGFAYYVPLKSGWNAGFEVVDYDRDILAIDSTVNWFFRY